LHQFIGIDQVTVMRRCKASAPPAEQERLDVIHSATPGGTVPHVTDGAAPPARNGVWKHLGHKPLIFLQVHTPSSVGISDATTLLPPMLQERESDPYQIGSPFDAKDAEHSTFFVQLTCHLLMMSSRSGLTEMRLIRQPVSRSIKATYSLKADGRDS